MGISILSGGYSVSAALLLGASAAAGLGWSAWRTPARSQQMVIDAGLAALLGALLGGRLVFVLLQWEYYRSRLAEVPRFDGLSGPGALAGGLLALWLISALSHQLLAFLADALLPMGALVSIAAWLTCWELGCACGPEGSGWWALRAPDFWGQVAPRLPLQLLAALLTLGILALLDWLRPHLAAPGMLAALALAGCGMVFLLISALRVDPIPRWLGLRLDAWAGLAYVCTGFIWLFLSTRVRE